MKLIRSSAPCLEATNVEVVAAAAAGLSLLSPLSTAPQDATGSRWIPF